MIHFCVVVYRCIMYTSYWMQQTWVRNLYVYFQINSYIMRRNGSQTRIGFKIFLLLWSDWRFSNEDTYTVDNTIECEKEQNRSKNIYLCFLSIIYALCIHLTIKLACFWLVAWMAVLVWEGGRERVLKRRRRRRSC